MSRDLAVVFAVLAAAAIAVDTTAPAWLQILLVVALIAVHVATVGSRRWEEERWRPRSVAAALILLAVAAVETVGSERVGMASFLLVHRVCVVLLMWLGIAQLIDGCRRPVGSSPPVKPAAADRRREAPSASLLAAIILAGLAAVVTTVATTVAAMSVTSAAPFFLDGRGVYDAVLGVVAVGATASGIWLALNARRPLPDVASLLERDDRTVLRHMA